MGVSTGIRLPAGLSVGSPALDGPAVTPHNKQSQRQRPKILHGLGKEDEELVQRKRWIRMGAMWVA